MKRPIPVPVQGTNLTDKDGKPTSHNYRWMESVGSSLIDTQNSLDATNTSISSINTSVTSLTSSVSILSTQKLTRSAIKNALTSPASNNVQFNDIPSWVKRITINCARIRTTAQSSLYVLIGSGTTPETTNYSSHVNLSGTNTGAYLIGNYFTTGFFITITSNPSIDIDGACVLSSLNDTSWVLTGTLGQQFSTTNGYMFSSSGQKTLSTGTSIGCVQILTNAGTFSAGSFSLLYE